MKRPRRRASSQRPTAHAAVHEQTAPRDGATPSLPPLPWSHVVLGMIVLVGAALAAYAPALRAGYVRFDDTDYIQDNVLLRTAGGLQQIWTDPRAYPPSVPFYPVTFSLHWIEFHLWGDRATGYHALSIALHSLNAALVWLILRRLALRGAWFGALLFALHPVQVQSVAWLAERKNVLAALFYLLAVLAWLRFARNRSWWCYGITALLFAAGLLSKTVVCTLPLALLLWIWWRRPPGARVLLAATIPLFCMAGLMGGLTYWHESTLLEGKTFQSGLSPLERGLIFGHGAWFYLGKLLWPRALVPIYPHFTIDTHSLASYAYPLGPMLSLIAAWCLRRVIGNGPLFGALFFLVTLAPTSGLVDFGYLGKSFVGDHYLYLPGLAIWGGIAAVGAAGAGRLRRWGRYGAVAAGAAAALALGARTARQCRVYADAESFWTCVAEHNPTPTALSSLGDVYLQQKDWPRAEALLRRALAQRDSVPTRFRLGCVLIEQGQFQAAAEQFEHGLTLNRTQGRLRGMNAKLLLNLGFCYRALGDYARSAEAYRQALEADPALTAARMGKQLAEEALRQQHPASRATTSRP